MECYPPCKTCSGLCKTKTPARRVASSTGKATRRKPVQVRNLPGYILLICGKYTTVEEQRVQYSMVNKRFPASYTRKTKFWCEVHQSWERMYTTREKLPEEQTEKFPF